MTGSASFFRIPSWKMNDSATSFKEHRLDSSLAVGEPKSMALWNYLLWNDLCFWLIMVVVALSSYVMVFRWARCSRPGPKSWPLMGCIPELLRNWDRLHEFFLEHFEKGHDCFWISYTVGKEGLFIAEPSLLEYVLKTNFSNYPKGERIGMIFEELLGDGIFNSDYEPWKAQRKVASYEFSHAKLRDLSSIVYKDSALTLLHTISEIVQKKESMDLQDLLMRMTLDSTVKIGFGVELGCLSPSMPAVPFAFAFDQANELSFRRYVDPFWKWKRALNIGQEKELRACLKVINTFSYDVITRRRVEVKSLAPCGKMETKPDLLSRSLSLSRTEGNDLYSDKGLRDIILNFIIAGRDTTGITLSWFIYQMCLRPEIAQKIVDEIINLLQQEKALEMEKGSIDFTRFADHLTFEKLGKLHYLHAALTETLRLYPAVPQDGKTAQASDVLPNGTKVRKGHMVVYSSYAMGRLERVWGADAKEFKPERWLKNGIFQTESPFKFVSFHAGLRSCLGKESAYLQMKMTAALLLTFFKFELVPDHEVTYRIMLVLAMKNGLRVTACPRNLFVSNHLSAV